jgi:hypothetical protein
MKQFTLFAIYVKVVLGLCNKWYSVGSIDLRRFFLYVPLVFIMAAVAAEPFEASCPKTTDARRSAGRRKAPDLVGAGVRREIPRLGSIPAPPGR